LQVNDKFFTAEFNDVIRHYLFSLADLFGPIDLYLTIGVRNISFITVTALRVSGLILTGCFGSKATSQYFRNTTT